MAFSNDMLYEITLTPTFIYPYSDVYTHRWTIPRYFKPGIYQIITVSIYVNSHDFVNEEVPAIIELFLGPELFSMATCKLLLKKTIKINPTKTFLVYGTIPRVLNQITLHDETLYIKKPPSLPSTRFELYVCVKLISTNT